MNKNLKEKKIDKKNSYFSSIYFLLSFTTLIFYSTFSDPFNVPKLISLLVFGSWLSGYLYLYYQLNGLIKKFRKFLVIFIVILLVQTLFSDVKIVSFFGDNSRRDGFFTYLFLSIIALFVSCSFKFSDESNFLLVVCALSIISSVYGILQYFELDFIPWTKSGGIFSFYGNSNFAGAVFAIFSILNFGSIFIFKSFRLRLISLVAFLLSTISIQLTNARQAQLIIIFCISCYIIYIIGKKSKRWALILLPGFTFACIVSVLGVFNLGPLSVYLFKESIALRIFYWKAGIKMLSSHPLTGIGIDRYGSYFKEFREVNYPLKYGFDITSSNAHNVPIQMFATGGVPLGIAYLCLVGFIFYSSIKIILRKDLTPSKKQIFVVFFLAWIAYQLQSLVSIDNIAIAIWGWTLGGILVAMASQLKNEPEPKIKRNLIQPIISLIILVPFLLLSVQLARAESGTFRLFSTYSPDNSDSLKYWKSTAPSVLSNPVLDPSYRTLVAGKLLDYREKTLGLNYLNIALKVDSRDLYALWGMALQNELDKDFKTALNYRIRIEKLDPWNAKNLRQMAVNYYLLGDNVNASKYKSKILAFAANTDIGKSVIESLSLIK